MSLTFSTPSPKRSQPTRHHSFQSQCQSQPQTPPVCPHSTSSVRPTPYTCSDPSRRPGMPRRAHSFFGDSATSTYALVSVSACSHLSPDKRSLVAPPLERTISSIGSKGNHSPPHQQMPRPERGTTPPKSPIPSIVLQSSDTPPRPTLSTLRTPSAGSSRSSSDSTASPSTPLTGHNFNFGTVITEEDGERHKEGRVDDVMNGVRDLMVVDLMVV